MFIHALPFTLSLVLVPLAGAGFWYGGIWVFAVPFYSFLIIPLIDQVLGLNTDNLDPTTQDRALFWHRLITWTWVPIQLCAIFLLLWSAGSATHLSGLELAMLTSGVGVMTGGIGITYAHELMHQRNRFERGLSEVLMISTLYGHFCIEHVYGHHKNVATPSDPATARFGENFYSFFVRVLRDSLISAWHLQSDMMTRRKLGVFHRSNPFWRYGAGYIVLFSVAYSFAGWLGLVVLVGQAFVAVMLLELIDYIEHYGLVRKQLENGRFERVQPHHSWNAAQLASNYLLINLQRHSDHHHRPNRRFPLLQNYDEADAPQLPHGYSVMAAMAAVPPLWFKVMDPKVEAWRAKYS